MIFFICLCCCAVDPWITTIHERWNCQWRWIYGFSCPEDEDGDGMSSLVRGFGFHFWLSYSFSDLKNLHSPPRTMKMKKVQKETKKIQPPPFSWHCDSCVSRKQDQLFVSPLGASLFHFFLWETRKKWREKGEDDPHWRIKFWFWMLVFGRPNDGRGWDWYLVFMCTKKHAKYVSWIFHNLEIF